VHFLKYAAQTQYHLPQNAVYMTILYFTTQIILMLHVFNVTN